MKNQQLSLKPQDLVVLIKLAFLGKAPFTYKSMGKALFISPSEVYASLVRARLARLVAPETNPVSVFNERLRELMLHGARFVFPPITGALVRGIPTAHAAPAMRDLFVQPDEPVPVWPYSKGTIRGLSLQPLYPTVPQAAAADIRLYNALSFFDAIRMGGARERELASEGLNKMLV